MYGAFLLGGDTIIYFHNYSILYSIMYNYKMAVFGHVLSNQVGEVRDLVDELITDTRGLINNDTSRDTIIELYEEALTGIKERLTTALQNFRRDSRTAAGGRRLTRKQKKTRKYKKNHSRRH